MARRPVPPPSSGHSQRIRSSSVASIAGDGRPSRPGDRASGLTIVSAVGIGDDARPLRGRVHDAGDEQQDERGYERQVIAALHGQVDEVAHREQHPQPPDRDGAGDRNICGRGLAGASWPAVNVLPRRRRRASRGPGSPGGSGAASPCQRAVKAVATSTRTPTPIARSSMSKVGWCRSPSAPPGVLVPSLAIAPGTSPGTRRSPRRRGSAASASPRQGRAPRRPRREHGGAGRSFTVGGHVR